MADEKTTVRALIVAISEAFQSHRENPDYLISRYYTLVGKYPKHFSPYNVIPMRKQETGLILILSNNTNRSYLRVVIKSVKNGQISEKQSFVMPFVDDPRKDAPAKEAICDSIINCINYYEDTYGIELEDFKE